VPPDQRKPLPGAYGAVMLTKKGVFGITVGHQNRHLAIDPKTGGLFVGVGSSGNLGVEPEPKATIQRFDADGSNQTTFASGIRNATGLRFHPETGELWAVAKDGSLLVADDTGGTIWRISYKGPPAEQAGGPAESTGSAARKQ
jgi:glucose/arabinose dehydrogenase